MQVFFVMNFLCLAPTHSDWARWDTLVFYCWPKWQRRLPQTNSLSTSIRQNSGQGSLTWQCYQGDNIVIRSALALNGSYCSQQQQHLSIPLYKQSCLKFHSFVYAISDAVAHIFKGYYWYSYVCICHFESGSVWSFRRSVVHRFILFPLCCSAAQTQHVLGKEFCGVRPTWQGFGACLCLKMGSPRIWWSRFSALIWPCWAIFRHSCCCFWSWFLLAIATCACLLIYAVNCCLKKR